MASLSGKSGRTRPGSKAARACAREFGDPESQGQNGRRSGPRTLRCRFGGRNEWKSSAVLLPRVKVIRSGRTSEWGDGIRNRLRARLAEWQGLLSREPLIAREILRKLLDGRLVMEPDA